MKGSSSRKKHATAAAWGEACDVPVSVLTPPPSPQLVMDSPGARRSRLVLRFVKLDIWSGMESMTEPTEITGE